ncbi:MAG: glycosyltransferase family 4 protein [Symploca sp. SIO2D2]|nr:glycosyltransferase family 4 protein [Symploca sp. SIO2D2]
MQSTSLIDTVTTSTTSSADILVVCRTFPPNEGGIEEYAYNRCLQDPERVIALVAGCPGDQDFDQNQSFPVHRWFLPSFAQGRGLSSLLKQVINMFLSPLLAVKLYLRYRYHYIEWGHGYDFPALLLLSYLLPVRCFVYLHGNDLLCPLKNPVLRFLFSWTLKRCAGIVCNSTFTKDYLQQHFSISTPTYVINPTVRPSKFKVEDNGEILEGLGKQIRQAHNIPETAVVILSVGRLVPRKGFARVIEYLPQLLNENLDVHYLVCGRGPMLSELKELASQLGVEKRVHFAGFVSDEQLAAYYSACDIFSLLTFFNTKAASIEGFGIVYLEAGYFAKPVIASRVGGVVDAVHHQETGLLVNPESSAETFQALLQLCQDQELRERLGQNGRQLAINPTPHSLIYKQLGIF